MSNDLYVIDARVIDEPSSIAGIPADAKVLVIGPEADGILQLQTDLVGSTGYDSLQIVSHGAAGSLLLGSTVLSSLNLTDYAGALAGIGQSLTPNGDILLYGCNIAQGSAGMSLINGLADLTGADVAASIDATGAAALGGNWTLEAATGAIEAPTLSLAGHDALLATVSPDQLAVFKQGLDAALDKFDAELTAEVFGDALPLLGTNLKDLAATPVAALHYTTSLRDAIDTAIGGLAADSTPQQVQDALNKQLGDGGIIGSVVLTLDATGNLLAVFDTARAAQSVDVELAADLAMPGLGLNLGLKTAGKAHTAVDYQLKFTVGVDGGDGGAFYLSTAPGASRFVVNEATSLPGGAIPADLGLLKFSAVDRTAASPDFSGRFDLTLSDNGALANDGRLSLTEFGGDVLSARLTGDARLDLHLATSYDPGVALPQIGTDLGVAWHFGGAAMGNPGDAPVVKFDNISLDAGSFLGDFAGDVLNDVVKVIKPILPIVNVLSTEVPLLSELGSDKVTVMDLLGAGPVEKNVILGLNALEGIANQANSIATGSAGTVMLGTLDGPKDVRIPGANLATAVAGANTTLSGASAAVTDFVSTLNHFSGGGLAFPLLTDISSVGKMLMGQQADLFSYHPTPLSVGDSFSTFFPVLGPFGIKLSGSVGLTAGFEFGYDTLGLQEFRSGGTSANIIDGFYVNAANTSVKLTGGLGVAAGVDVGLASFGVGGNLKAELSAGFAPGVIGVDGRVRGDTIETKPVADLLALSGELSAGLFAYVDVGVGPFSIGYEWDSPRVVLLRLPDGANGNPLHLYSVFPGYDIVYLNVGVLASYRNTGDISDGNETINVSQIGLGLTDGLSIKGFDNTQLSGLPSAIVAWAGEFDDTISLDDSVTVKAELSGMNGNDVLNGGSGDDKLSGDDGRDVLNGRNGNDDLDGGAGNDILIGGPGADKLFGGYGIDTASYRTAADAMTIDLRTMTFTGDGGGDTFFEIEVYEATPFNDTINGSENNDLGLLGGGGDDIIRGNGGNDLLDGGDGVDQLDGGEGDDLLIGGPGGDTLVGGIGFDTVAYTGSKAPVTVNLLLGVASGGDAQGDTLDGIESVIGSPALLDANNHVLPNGGDSLVGSNGDDVISGLSGSDTISGLGGNDVLYGNIEGIDSAIDNQYTPGFDDDRINGGDGNDRIYGQGGNDTLDGGWGNDLVDGGAGDDVLIVGSLLGFQDPDRLDQLDGGAGFDVVSADFSNQSQAVTVYVGQSNRVEFADGAYARNFESVGYFFSGSGNDQFYLDGPLDDGRENWLVTGDGNDLIYSGAGNDHVYAGAGNDIVEGGAGDDFLDGGDGRDTLSYTHSHIAVVVDLNYGETVGAVGSDSRYDTISNFEDILGSEFFDILTGTDGDNLIAGNGGDDSIYGRNGNNQLYGGDGWDHIESGSGDDIIFGDAGSDTILAGDGSNIIDGGSGDDRITTGVGADEVWGAEGKDTIDAGDGINRVYAGADDDLITTGKDSDLIVGGDGNDTVHSGAGNDFVSGDAGNDTLDGGFGTDRLDGGDGNDTLSVGDLRGAVQDTERIDHLFGGAGFDAISADFSTQTVDIVVTAGPTQSLVFDDGTEVRDFETVHDLATGSGADVLHLEGAADDGFGNWLRTGAGDDTVYSGAGSDNVDAGSGDDFVNGGANDVVLGVDGTGTVLRYDGAQEVLAGGDGNDTLSFEGYVKQVPFGLQGGGTILGVDVNLATNATGRGATGITISGFENLIGTAYADNLTGDSGANTISGGDGADVIDGADGDNQLNGNAGDDWLVSGSGIDTIHGDAGSDTVRSGSGNDLVFGDAGNDNLDGGIGADRVDGGEGDDLLSVGAMRGPVQDGERLDHLYGGAGFDTISADFSNQTIDIAVTAGLTQSLVFADGAEATDFENVHDLFTGSGNDSLRLDGAADDRFANLLKTGDGNDIVWSGAGSDNVDAGAGDDFVNGGSNDIVLTYEKVFGSITGYTGPAEILAGGAGNDTLSFEGYSKTIPANVTGAGKLLGVVVDLASNTTGRGATGITISGFENVIGTDAADELYGDAGDNTFTPLHGGGATAGSTSSNSDRVDGRGGIDTLVIDFSRDDLPTSGGVTSSAGNLVTGGSYGRQTPNSPFWTSDSVSFFAVEQFRITGTAQADQITGGALNYSDTLIGLGGNDMLGGNGGGDTLLGGDGNDQISGQGTSGLGYNGAAGGHDVFDGGAGDDLIEDLAYNGSATSLAADAWFQLDGGSGFDTLSADFSNQTSAIVWDSAAPTNVDFADGAYFHNFEALRWFVTGSGNDQISQRGRFDNRFYLGAGNDTLNPGLGVDTVDGGAGTDTLVLDFSVGDSANLGGVQSSGTFFSYSGNWVRKTLDAAALTVDNITANNIEAAQITGTSKADSLAGTYGNDILIGGDGNDALNGNLGGNDLLDGGNGDDTLIGSRGINSSGGNDTILGGAGNDTITPLTGSDTVYGGAGNDTITASDNPPDAYGVDLIDAGEGDDVVVDLFDNPGHTYTNAATRLKLDGGAGWDTLSADYGNETQAIVFVQGQGSAVEFADGSYIRNFETLGNFTAGSGNDSLLLSGRADNVLVGMDGNDTINPGLGIDRVYGGAGIDTLVLDYSQDDAANLGGVSAALQRFDLVTGKLVDSLYVQDFDRFDMTGGSKADSLWGGGLDDRLVGNDGNDVLTPGTGSDTVYGGAGNDRITAADYPGSVGYGVDLFDGGSDDDVVTDIAANQFSTLATATTRLMLDGGAGWDTLSADYGNETQAIVFTQGADNIVDFADGSYLRHFETLGTLITGSGNDTVTLSGRADNALVGGAGNDSLNPGMGVDRVDGGAGIDLLVLDYSADDAANLGGVTWDGANLSQRRDIATNALVDSVTILNFERFQVSGGSKADRLFGGALDDILFGNGGDDTITPGIGSDTVDGGDGNDTITTADAKGGTGTIAGYGIDVINAGAGDDVVTDGLFDRGFTFATASVRLQLDGGAGYDRLSADFGNQAQAIAFVEGSSNSTSFVDGAYFRNFESLGNFTAGSGNDTLVLNSRSDNSLGGGAGNDTINPGVGIDLVYGGAGDDTLVLDYTVGDGANIGGVTTSGAVLQRIDLSTNTVIDRVTVAEIEHWQVAGGTKADVLLGGASSDVLDGRGGADVISGLAGIDRLTGGAGADTFRDSAANLNGDTITDLGTDDVIEVSALRFSGVRYDAASGVLALDTSGNGSYATRINLQPGLSGEFLATASAAGAAASTRVVLMADSDGDGVADFHDNAPFVANPDQRDSDHDGFGNVVDADFNQDGTVDIFDLAMFDDAFGGANPDADLNGDGTVDIFDLAMLDDLFGLPVGGVAPPAALAFGAFAAAAPTALTPEAITGAASFDLSALRLAAAPVIDTATIAVGAWWQPAAAADAWPVEPAAPLDSSTADLPLVAVDLTLIGIADPAPAVPW